MKAVKILILVCLCCTFSSRSQSSENKKVHKVWVTLLDNPNIVKGYLYSADSLTIKVMDIKSTDSLNLKSLESNNIDMIKIRRKGAVIKSAGIGALSGLVVGGALGAMGKSSPFISEGSLILSGAARGAISGAGVGVLVSPKKIEIYVRGEVDYFAKVHKKLQYYTMKSY